MCLIGVQSNVYRSVWIGLTVTVQLITPQRMYAKFVEPGMISPRPLQSEMSEKQQTLLDPFGIECGQWSRTDDSMFQFAQ